MIPWEQTKAPQPKPTARFTVGACDLSVHESEGGAGKRWQWANVSFGEFSDATFNECLETWPKRAIKLAHQAVRELDRKLQELDK